MLMYDYQRRGIFEYDWSLGVEYTLGPVILLKQNNGTMRIFLVAWSCKDFIFILWWSRFNFCSTLSVLGNILKSVTLKPETSSVFF